MSTAPHTLARWTHDDLSLIVRLSEQGVHLISQETEHDPLQMFFWPDIDVPVPRLEDISPFGAKLADELAAAIEGRPFAPSVPWVPDRPDWHVEVYRELLRLPAGQITEVFAALCRHRWPQDRKAIMSAIRECALVPLAPLHRVASSRRQPIRFPWGRKWRDHLLEQEKKYQKDLKGGKPDGLARRTLLSTFHRRRRT